ncbi:MAG: NFACT family protein [Eubacterium sp.]|jgi:predicted ribosome quality control (RQC) complex YloA/Tae2 family protein|nr:NFACT family protein [Eubacterium sp.]
MSLDGAFLRIIKNELVQKGLIGARVDKVHQPSKEELVITLRGAGESYRLLLSASPGTARVCLTDSIPENPKTPPMFCMLLRKHLSGGRLENIIQDGLERIVCFDFFCMNEIGDMVKNRLAVEIMGRSSNIILMSEKSGETRVIDSIKRVTDEVSSVRRILPGIIYETPPREPRMSLFGFSRDELLSKLSENREGRLSKTIIQLFEGVSPIFAREAAHYCAKDTDIDVGGVLKDEAKLDKLFFFLERAKQAINGKPLLVIAKEKSGKPFDFCFVNIEQYGHEVVITPYENANLLLDSFFRDRAEINRSRQRSGELLKMLMNVYERILRRLENQKVELIECRGREALKTAGDIITANLYRIKKGDTHITAKDFVTGEEIKVTLSDRLSPPQNAQKYYSDYKRLDNADKKLEELIKSGEQELIYINSVFDAASRAATDDEVNEIRLELAETGYLKHVAAQKGKNGKKTQKQEKSLPPLRFLSSDKIEILVGRNNKCNDRLTFKLAKPNDIWLHTQNIAGSHVIVSSNGAYVSEQTLTEAALLAAYHSNAGNSSRVPVDYTEARYVKKPGGAKPGMVIFKNNKTLFVTPDKDAINKLKSKKFEIEDKAAKSALSR